MPLPPLPHICGIVRIQEYEAIKAVAEERAGIFVNTKFIRCSIRRTDELWHMMNNNIDFLRAFASHPIPIPSHPIPCRWLARKIAEATARDIAEAQAQARATEEEANAREQAMKIQRMQRWLAIAIQSRCRGIRARRYVQEKPAIDAATKVIPQNNYTNDSYGYITTWHAYKRRKHR